MCSSDLHHVKCQNNDTCRKVIELYVPAATDGTKCYTAYNATTQKYACYISLADGSNGGRSDSDSGSGLVELKLNGVVKGYAIINMTTSDTVGSWLEVNADVVSNVVYSPSLKANLQDADINKSLADIVTINTTLTDAKLPELQTLLSKPNYFKVPDATTRKRIIDRKSVV